MKSFPLLLCILCASFVLAGCSYFDTGEQLSASASDIEQVDLAPTYDLPSLPELVARQSRGRVQIFPLDGPQADLSYAPAAEMNMQPVQAVPPEGQSAFLDFARSPFTTEATPAIR